MSDRAPYAGIAALFAHGKRPQPSVPYVCIEGPKGAGKSTVIDLVCRALSERGRTFQVVAPTDGRGVESPFEGALGPDDPALWVELRYATRANHRALATDWSRGDVLVGDRSIVTSYVTRLHLWDTPRECVAHVNWLEWALPFPTMVLYLRADVETLLGRIATRPTRSYGLGDQTRAALSRTLTAYDRVRLEWTRSLRLPPMRWVDIDAMSMDAEGVANRCTAEIEAVIVSPSLSVAGSTSA